MGPNAYLLFLFPHQLLTSFFHFGKHCMHFSIKVDSFLIYWLKSGEVHVEKR
ncbi:hypothetical protein BX666DRAFT_1983103 [Dichotomocladium elegans]|nr:hypothetical protein BX666DRAFT_1983103 [Dichotomocladium elegans]